MCRGFLTLCSFALCGLFFAGCGSGTTAIKPPSTYTVSLAQKRVALSSGQTFTVTATTNDTGGVSWSATGGNFSLSKTGTGAATSYTAPSVGGAYTLKATSVSNPANATSMDVFVTDLPAMETYHNDLSRDGVNSHEFALTPTSVAPATFGKLASCPVDGAIYAQPLWVSNVLVNGQKHNAVLVATQHDSLYALDTDGGQCVLLWKASLIDSTHGGSAGETSVPSGTSPSLVGQGFGDIAPEVGITGTPVIDPRTNTLYVVTKSVDSTQTVFYQRLHAIDLTSGNEKLNGPATIHFTYPGTGDGGTVVTFNPQQQNQRPGLALVNGILYVAWSSHEDAAPYYGWIAAFKTSDLSLLSALNVTPNVQYGGIWMGGGAPAADESNHLYLITGNAVFDANSPTTPNNDYGDSFLRLTDHLMIADYFTPSDEVSDNANDADFGSGGSAVLLNLNSGPARHLIVGGGKDGGLYVLDGDHMGGLGDSNAHQVFNAGNGLFATGAFWNNQFYIAPIGSPLSAFTFNPSTTMFQPGASSQSSNTFGFPGATPSVSASGTTNGIVWALDNSSYCTQQSPGCGPTVLHAYSGSSVATELWNSSMVPTDQAGLAVKFTVPTVANGRVYVGTRGNNTGGLDNSTSTPGELEVYGLKSN